MYGVFTRILPEMEKTTASLKLITWEPKKDGTCPVKIVIIKRGRNARLSTDFACAPEDWDATAGVYRKHPDLPMQNAALSEKLARAVKILESLDKNHPDADVYRTKKLLTAELSGLVARPGDSFTAYAKKMADDTVNFSNRQHLKTTLSVLREYAGRELNFTEIDYVFCKSFEKWARETPCYPAHRKNRTDRYRSDSTVRGYFRDIRKVWNEAKKSSKGPQRAWLIENYPFIDYQIPKATRSKKTTFGEGPMEMVRAYTSAYEKKVLARDAFLLQFNLMGMRVRDVLMLEWKEVFDGYVHYDMNKNGKIKKIPVSDEAAMLMERHRRPGSRYVLPYLEERTHEKGRPAEKAIQSAVDSLNRGLRGMCDELGLPRITSHGSRRSLGWLLRNSGESVDTIQGLYGHADRKTTLEYLDGVDTSDADRVVKNILNKK